MAGRRSDRTLLEQGKALGIPVKVFPMGATLDLRVLYRRRAYVRAEGIDLVHTHNYRATIVARLAGSFMVTPTIGNAPLSVTLENTSTGDYAIERWDMDNSGSFNTPVSQDPVTFVYHTSGNYSVRLEIEFYDEKSEAVQRNILTVLESGSEDEGEGEGEGEEDDKSPAICGATSNTMNHSSGNLVLLLSVIILLTCYASGKRAAVM